MLRSIRTTLTGLLLLGSLPLGTVACRAPRTAVEPDVPEPLPLQWRQVGESVEGRGLMAFSVGEGARRVYLIGGIHGDERSGLETIDRVREWMRRPGNLGDVTVRVMQDANPDGSAHGTRTNARGVDLNRNFPAANFRPARRHGPEPLSEPEIAALWADLVAFDPHLVIVFHSSGDGPFVNFDGDAGDAARRFATVASIVDPRWHVRPDMGYPTPGSLGSVLGRDRGVGVLTVEFERDQPGDEAWKVVSPTLVALLGPAPNPEG